MMDSWLKESIKHVK